MSSYEPIYDKKYCYLDSEVLINLFGYKNKNLLDDAERDITNIKIMHAEQNPLRGNLDFKHLLDIHRFIFGDIYSWAGETRTVDISKGVLFCPFNNIKTYSEEIFTKLKLENYLIGLDKEELISRLAYYFGEINAIHPFREGNGRTQRVFVKYLCSILGYNVEFSKVSKEQMLIASIESMGLSNDKFEEMFSEILNPMSYDDRILKTEAICGKRSKVYKLVLDDIQKEE